MLDVAPDLVANEHSARHTANRDAIERTLLEPPRRPSEDAPLFTTLIATNKRGIVTMNLPESGGQCVPVFSAPVRAADYVEVCLARGPSVQYLVSSPIGLLAMLRDLRATRCEFVALDRCPRCAMFMSTATTSLQNPADLILLWCVVKATQLARLELYVGYALKSAQAGLFEIARQVAYETVAHVGLEDPRPHLLLGQLAVVFGDQATLREAKAFLHLLRFDAWERKLDQDAASGSLDFGTPAFFSQLQA